MKDLFGLWLVVIAVKLLNFSASLITDFDLREQLFEMFKSAIKKAEKSNQCPHGWENWDDCPDCRH